MTVATLKHDFGLRLSQPLRIIHGRMTVATLKPGAVRGGRLARPIIHGRMTVATLKLLAAAVPDGGDRNHPRSHDRGHIEAPTISYSTKTHANHPRSHDRGHIEAISFSLNVCSR